MFTYKDQFTLNSIVVIRRARLVNNKLTDILVYFFVGFGMYSWSLKFMGLVYHVYVVLALSRYVDIYSCVLARFWRPFYPVVRA